MMKTKAIFIILCLLGTPLFSQVRAVVREVYGKVEIKASALGWVPAEEGMEMPPGSWISTGFNSWALLDMGPSQLRVKQLTRLELEELIEREGMLTTGLNLRVGKVRAQVKTVEGLSQDFKIKSPVSTAAVRGCEFEFDGIRLKVFGDLVRLINLRGQSRTLAPGEESRTTGYDLPAGGEEGKREGTEVVPYITEGGGPGRKPEGLATVTIILEWPE